MIDKRIDALEGLVSKLIDIINVTQPPDTQDALVELWNTYVEYTAALNSEEG